MAKWGSSNIMLLHSAPHCCSQLFSQYGMSRQHTLMKDSFVTTSSPASNNASQLSANHSIAVILKALQACSPTEVSRVPNVGFVYAHTHPSRTYQSQHISVL